MRKNNDSTWRRPVLACSAVVGPPGCLGRGWRRRVSTVCGLRCVLFWALLALASQGCAARRYYADARLLPDPSTLRDPSLRDALLAELPQALSQAGIKRVAVVTPDGVHRVLSAPGETPELQDVPTPSLAALRAALHDEARGAEIDLLLPRLQPGDEGQRVAVSAQVEPNGSIVITQGPVIPASLSAPPTADEIRSRHGIAPSDLGEVRWTPAYLAVLDRALSLLSSEEKAFVSRILFVREHRSREPDASQFSTLAFYTRGAGAARIELYDNLIVADRYMFVGPPQSPLPASVRLVLHEIGHALADASYAAAQRDLMAAVSEYQTDENKLSKWIETREGDAPTVAEVDEFLDKIHRVEVSVHRIKHVGAEGPVIRAFRRARGQSRGPTRYGEDDIEESFAECFALFRADPDALRRIDPDAFAWFSAQGHLSSLAH